MNALVEPVATRTSPWRLRSRLGRAFAVVTVVVLLFVALAVLASIRFVTAGNALVYRLQPAQTTSKQLYADFLVEQNALRSYLINGQATSLAPYSAAPAARTADLRRLRHLTHDWDTITKRTTEYLAAVDSWEKNNATPAIAQKRKGITTVATAQTRARSARVASAADVLGTAIDDAVSSSRGGRLTAGVVAAVALGLAVAILVLAGVVVWRGLHRWVLLPVDSLGAQTRVVAEGDLSRAIEPLGPIEMTNLAYDVETMRARIVDELARAEDISEDLRRQGAELERSNADLQQFAYVASHDLSEPLRKVANFCQLIERQYGPQLDDRGRQYIWFAVDGAKRMQALINDLLALSRVGRTTDTFEQIDLDAKLDQAIANLGEQITATGATIERLTRLPTIEGDRALMISLLQNLIGNAIKYHRDDVPPIVRIGAERDGKNWVIRVSDNGIGIDPQYADRIFAVFQRLHLRDQYGGTGIGLALCRRIVDFHGGRIRLDTPDPGEGAAFVFSLPEGQHRARSDDE
ncbi:ATP-binding protein [uncultured Jatrophihabitans sp.]|uniref:sensor histidine kinase n=1 Tax=uncultured Jatrophihabitans sp. TaxID=1610747 RepID=UPI0035CBDBDB